MPPATPEHKERLARRLFERLDAELLQRNEPPVATTEPVAQAPGERREVEDDVTLRSPVFDERIAAAAPPAEPSSRTIDARGPRPAVVRAAQSMTITSLELEIPADVREQMRRLWGDPRPVEGRAAQSLATTAPALELPADVQEQMRRLPFKPPPPPGQALARTLQVPVLNLHQGKTVPFGDDSIEKAVAALPFAGATVGAAVVPFPRLSLEQYASLRAELSVGPERWAEILLRYHVMNEAARVALEEHWQTQLAASPEMRTRFEKALAEYTVWLRTQRG